MHMLTVSPASALKITLSIVSRHVELERALGEIVALDPSTLTVDGRKNTLGW